MVHLPHIPPPRDARPPRSPLRRLATHALWGLAVAVGLTLALAVVVSRMVSSTGSTHRGVSSSPTAPTRTRRPPIPAIRARAIPAVHPPLRGPRPRLTRRGGRP